jgi:hypothetical protein
MQLREPNLPSQLNWEIRYGNEEGKQEIFKENDEQEEHRQEDGD